MRPINCLIVDDEPVAREILRVYCSHIPGLHVIADCANVFEAKKIVEEKEIDLLFLDINMPVLDGIGFLKTLRVVPQVIFTTAYREYAATAFDLAACDYLVKPFSLERFIIAVDRFVDKLNVPAKKQGKQEKESFFLKAENKIYCLRFQEILFAEAKGNYTKITTTNASILPAISFSTFEQLLPPEFFIRVHRSFIISKRHITHVEGNVVLLNKIEIPIGSKYKENFLAFLNYR